MLGGFISFNVNYLYPNQGSGLVIVYWLYVFFYIAGTIISLNAMLNLFRAMNPAEYLHFDATNYLPYSSLETDAVSYVLAEYYQQAVNENRCVNSLKIKYLQKAIEMMISSAKMYGVHYICYVVIKSFEKGLIIYG